MAEVFEITRKACGQLLDSGKICDCCNGYGDWAVVSIERAANEWVLQFVANFENEYYACRTADECNESNLYLVSKGWSCCPVEYEVWHIVDDVLDACDDDFTSRYELRVYYRDESIPGKPNRVDTFDTLVDAMRAADLLHLLAWPTVVRCEVWDTFADGPESFCYSNTCI